MQGCLITVICLFFPVLKNFDCKYVPIPVFCPGVQGAMPSSTRMGTGHCVIFSFDALIRSKLLFIHAITGCDTTSRLYGIGKTLSKVQCSDELTKISEVFMQENANKDDIISAGEKALVLLYNGNSGDDLDALRYKPFQEKVVIY